MRSQKTKDIVIMGVLTAILFLGQVALSFLPNIEVVTLLIILYTLIYGRKVFLIIYTFVFLEGIIYGFGLWWINYLYIWSILAAIVLLFCRQRSIVFWSTVSGFFGLFFGTLCSVPYLVTGGPGAAFAYIIAGIPYDISHCIGNIIVCLVLFKPLYFILAKAVHSQSDVDFKMI